VITERCMTHMYEIEGDKRVIRERDKLCKK